MGSKPSKDVIAPVKKNDNNNTTTTTTTTTSENTALDDTCSGAESNVRICSDFDDSTPAAPSDATSSTRYLARLTPKKHSSAGDLLLIPPLGTCGGTRRSAMDSSSKNEYPDCIPTRSMSSSSPTAFIHGDNGNGTSCSPLQSTLSTTLTPRQTSAVPATGTVAFLPVAVRLNSYYAVPKKTKQNDKDEGYRSLEEEFVDAPRPMENDGSDSNEEEETATDDGELNRQRTRHCHSLFAIHLTSLRSTEGNNSNDTMTTNNSDDIQASVTMMNCDEVSVSGHEAVETTDFDLLDGSAASTATITTSKLRTAAPAALLSLSSNTRCTVEVLTDGDAPHRIQRARRIVVGVVTNSRCNDTRADPSCPLSLPAIPSPDLLDESQVLSGE